MAAVAAAAVFGSVAGVASAVGDAPPVAAQSVCGTDLASAAPRVTLDRTSLASNAPTTVNVSGSSFLTGPYQCGAGKYGGIYLFFGWVEPGGQWGPSHRGSSTRRGQFGSTYSYPGEGGGAEVRDDGSGTVRLVSFTAGGTSGAETPFHMDSSGNFSAPITIRGPVYTWNDVVTGASNSVDCRSVQCGVFTIGAHGIASRTNEVFTPVNFVGPGGPPPAPAGAGPGAGGAVAQPGSVGAPAGGAVRGGAGSPIADASGPTGGIDASEPDDGAAGVATPGAPGAPGVDATTTTTTEAAVSAEDVTRTERAGAVQVFDDGASGGSPPVGLLVGLTALVAALGLLFWRRRSHGSPLDPTPESP